MRITIETIPASSQRYETSGDWYTDQDGDLVIHVSECGNQDYEWLVAIHELIEQKLCEKVGITAETVDAFDMAFKGDGEPGDDPSAPYHAQHVAATGIEKVLAALLGVQWDEYDKTVARQG